MADKDIIEVTKADPGQSALIDNAINNYANLAPSVKNLPINLLPTPIVTLRRIHHIKTYEVMEADLDSLDQATQEENQSLGFASLGVGSFVSNVVSWVASNALSPMQQSVYVSTTIVLGVLSLYFGTTWLRTRKKRSSLLEKLKANSIEVQEDTKIS